MWHHFYENESYMIFPAKKKISGSYLKQNNSDLVFSNLDYFLKMSEFAAGDVTKMWYVKLWITHFWTQILHLQVRENVEKMIFW